MATNTRGRLRERFEGIHKNNNWIITHCQESLKLVKDYKPKLSKAIESLAHSYEVLDELAQDLYSKL